MTNRGEKQALEYCIEQIENSGKPGSEVVIGAMALWIAAHGDFELPESHSSGQSAPDTIVTKSPLTPSSVGLSSPTELVRFADSSESPDIDLPNGTDIERISTLNMEMQEIFHPLLIAAKMKMPTEITKKRKWNSKRKPEQAHSWEYDQVVNNQILHYYFNLRYVSEKSGNQLKNLTIDFGGKKDPKYNDFKIEAVFEQDLLEYFVLQESRYTGHDGIKLRNLVLLDESLKAGGSLKDWDKDLLGGKVHPNPTSPAVYNKHTMWLCPTGLSFPNWIGYDSEYDHVYKNDTDTLRVMRKYDPEKDALCLSKTYRHDTTIGENMEVDSMKRVARAFMNLIPIHGSEL